MRRAATILWLILFVAVGCAKKHPPADQRIVFLLPGVAGGKYATLAQAIEESSECEVRTVSWGAPFPLFMLNFSNREIHESAERKLVAAMTEYRQAHPSAQIDLIGHSAGCGVILGAMQLLPGPTRVHSIILLAPSVSPTFDLQPTLCRMNGQLHVFSSRNDTVFLQWRSGHFGTYDNVKTPAAGNVGFDLSSLDPSLRAKVAPHPYEPAWKNLGNDGGHFGPLSKPFIKSVIAPLFVRDVPADALPWR
jgi:hypothetical protein